AGLALEPQRRVDPRAARKDPQRAGGITDTEPDGALLGELGSRALDLARIADRRPVVDTGPALQERDEGELGRLDRAAHADLAGCDRIRGRARQVTDADLDAIPGEASGQEEEAGGHTDRGRDHQPELGLGGVHAAIVRDRWWRAEAVRARPLS